MNDSSRRNIILGCLAALGTGVVGLDGAEAAQPLTVQDVRSLLVGLGVHVGQTFNTKAGTYVLERVDVAAPEPGKFNISISTKPA